MHYEPNNHFSYKTEKSCLETEFIVSWLPVVLEREDNFKSLVLWYLK